MPLSLSWKPTSWIFYGMVKEGCPLGISLQQLWEGGEPVDTRMWPTAPGPHLVSISISSGDPHPHASLVTSHGIYMWWWWGTRVLVPAWRLGVGWGGHWAERVS